MTSMRAAACATPKSCSASVQIADFGMSRVLAHNKSHVSTDTHGMLAPAAILVPNSRMSTLCQLQCQHCYHLRSVHVC